MRCPGRSDHCIKRCRESSRKVSDRIEEAQDGKQCPPHDFGTGHGGHCRQCQKVFGPRTGCIVASIFYMQTLDV